MTVNRIALITFHACPLMAPGEGKSGGMNVYVRQFANSLRRLGVEVDIFTRDHLDCSAKQDDLPSGVRVIHLPGGPIEAPMEDLFDYLPEFLNELTGFRNNNNIVYDAVHSHYWLSGWAGNLFAAEMNLKHVVTFHTLSLIKMQSRPGEIEPVRRQIVEKELMANADALIAFSQHERDAMTRLYGVDPRKVAIVPCGVDLDRFHPVNKYASRLHLGLNGDKVLLYVGRIESLKGLDLLAHTAAQMQSVEEVKVLVVGGDDGKNQELDRIKRLTEELKVDHLFEFVGRVDQEELPSYYSAADVCVVPSFYESFGLAALESMACGTPVVASRVGGLPTVVKHGRTGYLQSWRCPEAFANSVEMIISSQSLRDSMGRAARDQAETLGWDNVASQMIDIYRTEW